MCVLYSKYPHDNFTHTSLSHHNGHQKGPWARFLSLTQSKLRLCSANHRAGYFSNLACDWLSITWAYSEQETESGPWSCMSEGHQWFKWWLIASPVPSHYLNQCWIIGTYITGIQIKIRWLSFKKLHLHMLSTKCQPSCHGPIVFSHELTAMWGSFMGRCSWGPEQWDHMGMWGREKSLHASV